MGRELLHTPEGVRDLYGTEYLRRQEVETRLHESIRLFGYRDIQTPTFEFFDVFSRETGTTPDRELYRFFDKEGNTLVLRPDFTPSIARCAAKYFGEEHIPLRFSYLGSTFINTSSLQGKLKESTQMGAELIGDPSVEADAEIISLVVKSLQSAGLKRFQVSVGDVEYFKGLCEEAGLKEETETELRVFISGKNYFAARELLLENGVAEPCTGSLLKIAELFGTMDSLSEARAMTDNPRSLAAIDRLERLRQLLEVYGVSEFVSFDLGLLSRYKYYTGLVFRAYTYGVGDAVVKGGRYDHLLHRFGKDAPAIGFCMVIDNILEALSRQKVEVPAPACVRTVCYDPGNFAEKLAEAERLRAEGHAAVLVCSAEDSPVCRSRQEPAGSGQKE